MFGKKKENKKTIDDEIEAYAMDTVEFIIDDLNKRGCHAGQGKFVCKLRDKNE